MNKMKQESEVKMDCKICRTDSVPEAYQVFSNDRWRVRHSQETNILGYCIVEPCRHFLDLSEANSDELAEYGKVLAAVMKVQRKNLNCERVYTFSLAEAVPHFHVHVIPRSGDFSRAYKGRGIMSYPLEPAADSNLVERVVGILRRDLQRVLR